VPAVKVITLEAIEQATMLLTAVVFKVRFVHAPAVPVPPFVPLVFSSRKIAIAVLFA
jgi:hypothetical protein